MKKHELKEFSELLTAAMEIYGFNLTPTAITIWAGALSDYGLDDVKTALSAHIRKPGAGKFAPKPADLIEFLQVDDGHLGAEEAWAMLPKSESDTAVWTEQMSQAWGIAVDLIESGDMVAARMAFRESYGRLVIEARAASVAPRWKVTLGHDKHGRQVALEKAVLRGFISGPHAAALLPDAAERFVDQRPRLAGVAGTAIQ